MKDMKEWLDTCSRCHRFGPQPCGCQGYFCLCSAAPVEWSKAEHLYAASFAEAAERYLKIHDIQNGQVIAETERTVHVQHEVTGECRQFTVFLYLHPAYHAQEVASDLEPTDSETESSAAVSVPSLAQLTLDWE